ncbi:cytochrome oxidase complex assembly protein 1-domain-containing protein [Cokeromyces recurvatus]|uniref:cytochrome oxidase complex assembly protein 1-domain-containing protein n=1 Tax=Cokeromyces recurvatus TaxID=90255 RepID=UPI00221E4757|nr:cytochrome oxidase complex assembly protein 1-domain-containing protein [Cokeromyces recurvatus]KAI7899262.1 cytochrome oxidase complex assembly protein 1-domain-containing protein [Cokeromyces recurvatus]
MSRLSSRSKLFTLNVVAFSRPATTTTTTRRLLTTGKTVVVERELPRPAPPSRKRWLWAGAGVGALVWFVGLGAALNHQRLSSSVVHGTLFMVRYDHRVISLIGDKVNYADYWPWISGSVNHLKGKIDIKFRIRGSKDEIAVVHFISKREGAKWRTIQFTVTRISDQKTIDIGEHDLTDTGEPLILDK